MAKEYRALSNIEHGEEGTDEAGQITNNVTSIPYGATVEGLSPEVMKTLWEAGVLEEIETAVPVVTRTSTPVKAPEKPPAAPKPGSSTPETPGKG